MNTFYDVFIIYDTDKAVNYSDAYEDSFSSIRKNITLVFEIGVNRGGSVRGWKEYFPNALIVGLEIDSNCYFEEDGISIEIGDATKKEFIDKIIEKYGYPNIVIDDGSHFSSDIKATYNLLEPVTKQCYVIEDYGTQFAEYHDGVYIDDGVSATNIVHKKIDELLLNKNTLKSIRIYHSICFLFKKGE